MYLDPGAWIYIVKGEHASNGPVKAEVQLQIGPEIFATLDASGQEIVCSISEVVPAAEFEKGMY